MDGTRRYTNPTIRRFLVLGQDVIIDVGEDKLYSYNISSKTWTIIDNFPEECTHKDLNFTSPVPLYIGYIDTTPPGTEKGISECIKKLNLEFTEDSSITSTETFDLSLDPATEQSPTIYGIAIS